MKFVLFRLLLNLKWFLANWTRSFICGLILISAFFSFSYFVYFNPFHLSSNEFLTESLIPTFLFYLLISAMCRTIGWGLSDYVPNPEWSSKPNNIIVAFTILILFLPTITEIWLLTIPELLFFKHIRLRLFGSFSLHGLFAIFLILRSPKIPTEEEYDLYRFEMKKIKEDKHVMSRRRKISSLILALAVLITLYFQIQSFIKIDELEKDLLTKEVQLQQAEEEIQRLNQIIQDSQISTDSIN
ncbi:hypothetical protein [Ekhidna sp.]|uniref:hypothetical protein n=1 Tax=Ekhidna sp. TaxID=2608089 RepID=UPI003B5A22E9